MVWFDLRGNVLFSQLYIISYRIYICGDVVVECIYNITIMDILGICYTLDGDEFVGATYKISGETLMSFST